MGRPPREVRSAAGHLRGDPAAQRLFQPADLRVGDCFDVPTSLTQVKDVQHHPCNEAHTGEVVGVADYPAGGDDPYPSESMLFSFADDLCARTFREYTGRDPFTDPVLSVGYFYPIEEGWRDGDHEVACYLLRLDEGPMTQSFRLPTS